MYITAGAAGFVSSNPSMHIQTNKDTQMCYCGYPSMHKTKNLAGLQFEDLISP